MSVESVLEVEERRMRAKTLTQQVCVEPRTSALNMTLTAAAAQAPAAAPAACAQAAASGGCRSTGQTGRRTDTRPDRYIDSAPHTMRAAPITVKLNPQRNEEVAWRKRQCNEQCQVHAGEEGHARPGSTTPRRGRDSPWKSQ